MSLKHMSLMVLLAAPMATQAAMVEMNETELSAVNGQAMFSGHLFDYSATFALNPYYTAPDYDVTYSPVMGGVQRDSSFYVNWEVNPSWTFGVTGKYSGTPYVSTSGSGNWDPIDISYFRSRTFRLI